MIYPLLLTLITTVLAQPREGFPFQKQLPSVARVNQQYHFQLNNETYISDFGSVSLSISENPEWLTFDSSSRILSGIPTEDDIANSVTFLLTATDSESSISSQQTLLVSNLTGPIASTEFTVLSQLAEFGQTNGINALVLAPGEIFNVTFDAKTFVSDDEIVAYYGTSSNHSPLPNWLFFDPSNLRFSGVAPVVNSEIAPGFAYTFNFIATDFPGYSGSSLDFNIIVGANDFTTSLKSTININGTSGVEINFNIPLESVYQKGVPVKAEQISSTILEGNPDWLSLDNFTLTGVIPEDYKDDQNSTFNVTLFDAFSNSVHLFFEIELISSLFAVSSFRTINATRGEYFQYYFLPTDFTDFSKTNVSIDTSDDGDWLEYHSSNLTITGVTPDDFDQSNITVIATDGSIEDSLPLVIYGVDAIDNESSSSSSGSSSTRSSSSSRASSSSSSSSTESSSSTASSSADPTATNEAQNKSTNDNNKKLAIGLGVGIPLFAIIVAALLIVFCCMRRRRSKSDDESGPDGQTPKISKPILGNPANGHHNMISPNAFDSSSTDGSFRNEKDLDDDEEPKRLGALNVLKLDEKDYYSDNASTSTANNSSFGIHEDTKSSIYQDALQSQSTDYLMAGFNNEGSAGAAAAAAAGTNYPKRSWRQTIDSRINRDSLNSLASVSTNELLSMKLADDDDIKKDPRKSNLNFRDSAFLGQSTSAILTRDDSGNIQRLDSDGNIVDSLKESNSYNTRQRASKATDLDILTEEHGFSPVIKQNTHENSFTSNNSSGDEFYPVRNHTSNGETEWRSNNKPSSVNNSFSVKNDDGSKARLKKFTYKVKADTNNDDITQSTYETAEIESL